MTHKGKTDPLEAYVIRGHTVNNLLSRPLSVEMKLVRRVDETISSRGHVKTYGEHGTIKTEPVSIQQKDNARPFAVHTAQRILYLSPCCRR